MTPHHHHDDHHHHHHHHHDPDVSQSIGCRVVRRLAALMAAAVVLLLLRTLVVFVDEAEYVIVERLGHIVAVYDRKDDCGLHFKWPWPVGSVRRFDRRMQLYDPPGREMFTRDKKNITIDTFICWKIAEPETASSPELAVRPVVRFFRSLGDRDVAEARLDSRVRSILSTRIGQEDLSNLLTVGNSEAGPRTDEPSLLETMANEVHERVKQRPAEADSIRDRLGIEIVDVRIKRINFPAGNQQAVFERMKSERKKIADRYRSDGMAENTVIKSQAERQYNEILARANADAERIRGAAEAEAIAILNKAHAQDPQFYRVIRTLDSYRTILNERTTLVLSASSNLLKLLTEGIPEMAPPQPAPAKTPTKPSTGMIDNRRWTTPAAAKGDTPSAANAKGGGSERGEQP